ncbi:MAG: His-Xaa-Ser system radical SAM maturase HxsB [Candidatus Omnitrophota bacterium]|nr:His-Xaa-Ser system radical SAM maturase HxsB [Candidatus Omnitrophota bacterium]
MTDRVTLPFNSRVIRNRYLVSNALGNWDFLEKNEFQAFHGLRLKQGTPLFRRLYEKGLLADEHNIKTLVDDYRNLNANIFHDTRLHIAVVTTRCNLRCCYCQAHTGAYQDMDITVASRVLKNIFDVKSPCVTLEFQGGEPLLNWETVRFLIEQATKINNGVKQLQFSLTSNLTLLDDEKMKFLTDHGVGMCGSLDGPRHIHDHNRTFAKGAGSYDTVVKNIHRFETAFGAKIGLLPTVTKHSLPYYKDIVDEYVRLGQSSIALRPVNQLGHACAQWNTLGYTAEEFSEFYRKALEYILSLNKKGIFIRERMAAIMLEKVLNKKDPGYVELMNPCGAGRGQIVYMPDGSCYPCDESRMVGDEMFKLGNILDEDYEDLMHKENLLHLLESSLMNLWDYNSAFAPWMGTCPVVNYAAQKNFVPKIWCSAVHKIYTAQFNYLFEKMEQSEENTKIFRQWIKKEGVYESKK